MTSSLDLCTRCDSSNLVKNGHNICGNQQYRCKDCGAGRVLHPKSPGGSPERKEEILNAHKEGMSLRGIARKFKVSRTTLSRWIPKRP